ncbi:fatty acyl-CoA reductase 1 isoform X2 [Orussus abietinus]|uniref:fatty acyl-CoA reductase 1 isoform X2 n=1 Tax=Orussus abietinus TaxID=222816 RepID=UPI000626743E|nr:fatty acyl-CoA reductase 1 isoform X2 [Orussus abietinus]
MHMDSPKKDQPKLDDLSDESDVEIDDKSEICHFFRGCNVLVTGGSGFLGLLLIEKLLRSCSDINKLYLLIRPKKGKSPEERLKEIFDRVIYERLKVEQPNFMEKVVLIEGDMGQKLLGLSEESRKRLLEINIVFHLAATVRFDEKLRTAVNINVRGTKEIVLLAKQMRNLKVFMYVSTAFSHYVRSSIDEVCYPPPIDVDRLLTIVENMDDAMLEAVQPMILGKWEYTYTFSKAVAEDTVLKYGAGMPICIVRPPIVLSTAKDPSAGWINNVFNVTGIFLGAGIGILRTMHCHKNKIMEAVPADYVINNMICAAWDVDNKRNDMANSLRDVSTKLEVYNCVSSNASPITYEETFKKSFTALQEIKSTKILWHYGHKCEDRYWVYYINMVLFHLVPAVIVDTAAILTGRKPMLMELHKKVNKMARMMQYIATHEWKFYDNNVQQLWDKLNRVDRKEFNFNMKDFNWDEFMLIQCRGIQRYILKDTIDDSPEKRAHMFKVKIRHYVLVTVMWSFVLWLFVSILRYFGFWW